MLKEVQRKMRSHLLGREYLDLWNIDHSVSRAFFRKWAGLGILCGLVIYALFIPLGTMAQAGNQIPLVLAYLFVGAPAAFLLGVPFLFLVIRRMRHIGFPGAGIVLIFAYLLLAPKVPIYAHMPFSFLIYQIVCLILLAVLFFKKAASDQEAETLKKTKDQPRAQAVKPQQKTGNFISRSRPVSAIRHQLNKTRLGRGYVSLWSLRNTLGRLEYVKWTLLLYIIGGILMMPFYIIAAFFGDGSSPFLITLLIVTIILAILIVSIPAVATVIQRLNDTGLKGIYVGILTFMHFAGFGLAGIILTELAGDETFGFGVPTVCSIVLIGYILFCPSHKKSS